MTNGKVRAQTKKRELIYRALTDPDFRKKLQVNPASALGLKELSKRNVKEVQTILQTVKDIDAKIGHLADELLCANGGPCGIA